MFWHLLKRVTSFGEKMASSRVILFFEVTMKLKSVSNNLDKMHCGDPAVMTIIG